MRYVVAAFLCLVPFSNHGAELVKRSKTKAVLNLKDGQVVTVTGDINELEIGIAYQVRLDKP